jgi:ribonuclease HI
MNKVVIYTDGSCLGNPGNGGYAAILYYNDTILEIWGGEKLSTNNRMELTAVIKAFEQLKKPCNVELYADSKYVLDAFDKGWLKDWKAKGWRTSAKKPVKNRELWEALDALVLNHKITWKHIYGHTGHAQNERCDELAKAAAVQAAQTGDFFQTSRLP